MKRTIVAPEYEYICDVCGEKISQDFYDDELVTLEFDVLYVGIGEYTEHKERHVHRKCLEKGIKIDVRGELEANDGH